MPGTDEEKELEERDKVSKKMAELEKEEAKLNEAAAKRLKENEPADKNQMSDVARIFNFFKELRAKLNLYPEASRLDLLSKSGEELRQDQKARDEKAQMTKKEFIQDLDKKAGLIANEKKYMEKMLEVATLVLETKADPSKIEALPAKIATIQEVVDAAGIKDTKGQSPNMAKLAEDFLKKSGVELTEFIDSAKKAVEGFAAMETNAAIVKAEAEKGLKPEAKEEPAPAPSAAPSVLPTPGRT